MFKGYLVARQARVFAGLMIAGLLVLALLPARLFAPATAQQAMC